MQLLTTRFVPVAVDLGYFGAKKKWDDIEGVFVKKLIGTASQGHVAVTADGTVLGHDQSAYDADGFKRMLQAALDKFRPDDVAAVPAAPKDFKRGYDSVAPPEGGLVVYVTSKVLACDDAPKGADREKQYSHLLLNSLGSDRLWIRKDEVKALADGKFPESLTARLVRYHLVDTTRGLFPGAWDAKVVRQVKIVREGNRVRGSASLDVPGQRSYRAELLGFIEAKEGQVTRFDLVVKGTYTMKDRSPLGRREEPYPLLVVFTLADDRQNDRARLPPFDWRQVDYLK